MKKLSTCLLLLFFSISCFAYEQPKSKAQNTANTTNKTVENANKSVNANNSNQNAAIENPTPKPTNETKPLIELKDGQKVTFEIKQVNSTWDFLTSAAFWVSFCAFGVSVFTAIFLYRGFKLSAYQMRLSSRIHFQDLLIEQSKLQVNNPELWGVWDTHSLHNKNIINDPTTKDYAKLQSQAYVTINIFEIVFGFYNDSPKLRGFNKLKEEEAEAYEAWRGYFKHFIRNSTIARTILFDRKESKEIYNKRFWIEVEEIEKELNIEEKKRLENERKLQEEQRIKEEIEQREAKEKEGRLQEIKRLESENRELNTKIKKLEENERLNEKTLNVVEESITELEQIRRECMVR
jgi:hypothetical protein